MSYHAWFSESYAHEHGFQIWAQTPAGQPTTWWAATHTAPVGDIASDAWQPSSADMVYLGRVSGPVTQPGNFNRYADAAVRNSLRVKELIQQVEAQQQLRHATQLPPVTVTPPLTAHSSVRQRTRALNEYDYEHSPLVGRRQAADGVRARREAIQERQEIERVSSPAVDWGSTDIWVAKDGRRIPIETMDDRHLHNTIAFCVRRINGFFNLAGGDARRLRSSDPKRWLARQPLFRALLQVAIRRGFSFPTHVFNFIEEFVLNGHSSDVAFNDPCRDPVLLAVQQQTLARVLRQPVVPAASIEEEFGKAARRIELPNQE